MAHRRLQKKSSKDDNPLTLEYQGDFEEGYTDRTPPGGVKHFPTALRERFLMTASEEEVLEDPVAPPQPSSVIQKTESPRKRKRSKSATKHQPAKSPRKKRKSTSGSRGKQ